MHYDVIHASLAPRAPDRPETLGFLYNHGGLNNQKMAIAGLFVAALQQRRAVNLPYVYVKDQRASNEYLARFHDVFELDAVADFAGRHGLTVNPGLPSGERGGWDWFGCFGSALGDGSDPRTVKVALDAITSLQPRIASHSVFTRLKQFLFSSLGIQMVIQLRIERDWQVHAHNLRSTLGSYEDYDVGFTEILAKVRNTFPELMLAYATADEQSMLTPKEEIRMFSRDRFGIGLLWKSDFIEGAQLEQLSPLDLSMIDYEIAGYSPQFVGHTASTFANMLCLEKFTRTRRDITGHFIYNCLGDVVRQRRDNGFAASAQAALLPGRPWEAVAEY